jgi:hypothetical protein
MFGKSSTSIGAEEFGRGEMKPRDIRAPGTHYEYDDVRVNRLSLSLTACGNGPSKRAENGVHGPDSRIGYVAVALG